MVNRDCPQYLSDEIKLKKENAWGGTPDTTHLETDKVSWQQGRQRDLQFSIKESIRLTR